MVLTFISAAKDVLTDDLRALLFAVRSELWQHSYRTLTCMYDAVGECIFGSQCRFRHSTVTAEYRVKADLVFDVAKAVITCTPFTCRRSHDSCDRWKLYNNPFRRDGCGNAIVFIPKYIPRTLSCEMADPTTPISESVVCLAAAPANTTSNYICHLPPIEDGTPGVPYPPPTSSKP